MTLKELRDKLKALLDKRAPVVTEMQSLYATADSRSGEEHGFSADERSQWDRMGDDVARWETEERDLRQMIRLAELEERGGANGPDGGDLPGRGDVDHRNTETPANRREQAELRNRAEHEAMEDYVRYGATSPLLRSAIELPDRIKQAIIEARGTLPQSSVTPNLGGVLVGETWANGLTEALLAYGGILAECDVMRTATGDTMHWPTDDQTTVKGRIIGENAANAVKDLENFDEVLINAFMYTSDIVLVPLQLLMDSLYDIEGYVNMKMAERIARIMATHLAVGTGTGQPQGIVPAATAGHTTAVANAVSHPDMLAVKHSVNRAYRRNAKWGFADSTLLALKSIVDTTGLPLWNPNIDSAEASRYDGDRYFLDDEIPDLATTGNKCVLYGDFKYHKVRIVRDTTLFRYGEKYMNNHQIGYQAFMRADARFVDAGGGAVKALVAG